MIIEADDSALEVKPETEKLTWVKCHNCGFEFVMRERRQSISKTEHHCPSCEVCHETKSDS